MDYGRAHRMMEWEEVRVRICCPTRRRLVRDFRELEVWCKAHEVTLAVYRMTRMFPREEAYGLTAQMRRSAASICANTAEGCGRRGGRELARFLQIAAGSASELEYHLLLAADLKLVDGAAHGRVASLLTQVRRMLSGFLRTLRAKG